MVRVKGARPKPAQSFDCKKRKCCVSRSPAASAAPPRTAVEGRQPSRETIQGGNVHVIAFGKLFPAIDASLTIAMISPRALACTTFPRFIMVWTTGTMLVAVGMSF